jgi:hypothetical protein
MILRAAALVLVLGTSAGAQALSPEEFQALTEGHAFATHFSDGQLQGIEIFLKDRKVIWQGVDGTCLKGQWQVEDGHVCYSYEGYVEGHCLIYRSKGNEITGRSTEGLDFTLRKGSATDVTCPMDVPLLSQKETVTLLPAAATR